MNNNRVEADKECIGAVCACTHLIRANTSQVNIILDWKAIVKQEAIIALLTIRIIDLKDDTGEEQHKGISFSIFL